MTRFQLACLVVTFAGLLSVPAMGSLIWQIGREDHSYEDLAIAGDHGAYPTRFPRDVTFRAGDSETTSWPFILPGPTDAWAGSRSHTQTVVFEMEEQPSTMFELALGMVDTHASVPPTVEVSVNGRKGIFALPPGAGDASLNDASRGRNHTVTIPLPAKILQRGENRVEIRSVSGSWLLWDYLRLSSGVSPAARPGVQEVKASATPFLVEEGGRLKTVLEVRARCAPGTEAVTIALECAGKRAEVSAEPDLLGVVSRELTVNEVRTPCEAKVTATAGDTALSASCQLTPQRHWTLYIQPSAHVDIGYTDLQERVVQLHTSNMSTALDLCRKFPDFKWNTEAAWVQDQFLSGAPRERRQEFVELARQGRIGCTAIYGNMLTGICSGEELIRNLYWAHDAAKTYGIPFDIAMSSDVPTQVWTLPSVLAGSGIRYFSAGLNLTRGDSFNRLFAESPFWWEGPDGGRVLAWFAPGYSYASVVGLAAGMEKARHDVPRFLKGFEREDYPYDAVLGFGGFSDNVALSPTLAETVHEWNQRYAYPRIVLCRGPEFFEHIEHKYARALPVVRGCGGTYWEDGAGSSAFETAINIRAKEDLATAEKLQALAFAAGADCPLAAFNAAWKQAILYDEHTWGAAQSISEPESLQTRGQWAYKKRFADEAARQSRELLERGMSDAVTGGNSLTVFNPHSWAYTGPARVLRSDQQIWVEDVPALALEQVRPPRPVSREVIAGDTALENQFYRLSVDPATGAVRSLFDKELGLELAEQGAPYGLNQYVYVAGQGDSAKDATAIGGVRTQRVHHPFGLMIRVTGKAFRTPAWASDILMYDSIKRIDFLNRIEKEETYEKEAGYFAFPLGLDKPEFYIQLPNGVVRPKQDMLDGACMAWYSAQDFVAASDARGCVIWSAWDSPLITLGDINREKLISPIPIENGRLFAYVFNNYWFTNYKASQGGPLQFRFSLTSSKEYDPVAATRFGQAARNSPVVWEGAAKAAGSLCSISPGGVMVQAVKVAQQGDAIVFRLRELTGRKTRATLRLPQGQYREVWLANLVEGRQRQLALHEGQVNVTVPASGLATVIAIPAARR